MLLSDAILLGAMLREQSVEYFNGHGTCAIGSCGEAIGIKMDRLTWTNDLEHIVNAIKIRWPLLLEPDRCPICRKTSERFDIIARHLGGCFHPEGNCPPYTREAIAAWVKEWETPEPEQGTVSPIIEAHKEVSTSSSPAISFQHSPAEAG